MLAPCAQASLYAGGTHVAALVGAQEHVLELHHAGIDEHQCGVIAGDERAGCDDGMAFAGEEVEEGFADVGD